MELAGIQLSSSILCFQLLLLTIVTVLWRRYSILSDVPGPVWARFTRLWHAKHIKDGTQKEVVMRLHDQLGPFVRIAPDEVSVTHPDGIRKLLLSPLRKVCIT